MSENSEVPEKPQESEIADSGGSSEKGKELKRNYCYVCEIQCTALKNFLDHQNGKKHLKKLQSKKIIKGCKRTITRKKKKSKECNKIKKKPKQQTQTKVGMNSTGKSRSQAKESLEADKQTPQKIKADSSKTSSSQRNLKSNKLRNFNEKNSKEPELHGNHNSGEIGMNNSKRLNPKYKGNQYNQNNYSKLRNSQYYYNYEDNQGYFYNKRPKATYSRWGPPLYSDAPPMHNNFRDYEYTPGDHYYSNHMYNNPFPNQHFSGNINNCMPHDYVEDGAYLPYSAAEPEGSEYNNFLENEVSETQILESNAIPSKSTNKSSTRDKSNLTDISETSNSKQNTVTFYSVDSNKSSATKDTRQVNSSHCSPILTSSAFKVGEKRRLRTLSLSSAESVNNDKKLRDKNENVSADSESTPDEQKLKEYTTSLLETNPNRISLMIQHPSSHKEKAVLNHIMTSFSKTKRKENLTRKLRSNSIGSLGNNDDSTLDIQSASSENEEISIILPSEMHAETGNSSNQNKSLLSQKRNGKNSEECILDSNLSNKDVNITNSHQVLSGNPSSGKSSKVNGKSRVNSLSASKSKTLEKRREKSSESIYPPKRKSSDDEKRKDKSSESNCLSKRKSSDDEKRKDKSSESICLSKRKSTDDEKRKEKSLESSCSSKRKSIDDGKNSKSKKHKSSNEKNLASPMSRKAEQKDANKDMSSMVNSYSQSSDIQINPLSHNEIAVVKEEVTDSTDINQVPTAIEMPESVSNPILDCNAQFSVETLIELFASGNVAVKKEFNDPVIDAIQGVDPNELINACSNDSHLNSIAGATHGTAESNALSSKSLAPVPNFSIHENTNCINPVILGSTVDSDMITPVPMAKKTVIPPSPVQTEIPKEQNSSTCNAPEKDSLSETEKLNLIGKVKSEFPQFINMIEKLQEIACKEETIRENIAEAKLKINEYSNLLEEWKNKKKKLHDEEEELRKMRNDIIQSMQSTVNIPDDTNNDKNKDDFLPEVHSTPDKGKGEQNATQAKISTETSSATISSSDEQQPKLQKSNCLDSDEILILPSPVKPVIPEITIIDDTEEVSTGTQSSSSTSSGKNSPILFNQGSSLLDAKNLTAHATVVNCIVVFDDFVYTCSNDNSARRFSLKDTSQTITYVHTAKNVTEIAVEKVQNEALVFTSCSNRVLSLFIASNGTKIKTFFQSSSIRSICKGWGKFYAAMEDGTVNVYNWKYEEKEFVKTHLCPVSRIATVHQGGLHILIILTTDGQVSLRDAKTSLLIRCIKTSIKFPAWLTVHNDFVYLSSSDRTVSVLDIQSGIVERQWQLGHNHPTGLAVCDDYFFTISYSGIICCVNKEKFSDVTLFYGAGKTGLTCIHVYQNWVFTGNRKGDISVLKFDPNKRFSCKIAKCKSVFGSKEDLIFHFELMHLKKKNLALCQWDKCPFIFPVNYTTNDKISHLKKHILPLRRKNSKV